MSVGIPQDDRSPFRQQRWIEGYNVAGEDLPAYGIVAISASSHEDTGETVLHLDQFSSTADPALCAVVGLQPGRNPKFNQVTLDFPAYVLYDYQNDGLAQNGEEWGPAPGSYLLRKGRPGFLVCGDGGASGAGEPVVRVVRNPSAGLVRFELTADLDLAGTAAATLLDNTWTDTGVAITVRDPYTSPGCWQGYTGYRGLALKRSAGVYDVVWMERRALIIEFTLTQNTNTSSGTTATVNYYYQQGDKNPGATVLVYDTLELYPKALSGAKGLAIWNDRRKRYEVLVCQQMGNLFYAQANSDFCPTDTTVSGTYLGKYQHSPFNQAPNPAPSTFTNYYSLAGQAGDKLAIRYDYDAGTWDIVQVSPHLAKIPTDFRVVCDVDGTATLQMKGEKHYDYYCKQLFDWEDVGDIGTTFDAVNNVISTGSALLVGFTQITVLCVGDSHTETVDTYTNCDSSASS